MSAHDVCLSFANTYYSNFDILHNAFGHSHHDHKKEI